MPSDAVAVTASTTDRRRPPAARREPPALPEQPPGGGARRSRSAGRSTLLAAAAVLVSAWLVLVFGGALSELNETTERADALRGESAVWEQRLEAARRELELVQGDEFQRLQARAYGLGRDGERAFALEPGAPSPAPVIPLAGPSTPVDRTPLEAWLGLLFGP